MTDFLTQIINTSKRRGRYKDLQPQYVGGFLKICLAKIASSSLIFLFVSNGTENL